MNPKLDDPEVLQVLASEFGVDIAPAAKLQGKALRAWIGDQEDRLARLMLKISYMPNHTRAERDTARARLEELREAR